MIKIMEQLEKNEYRCEHCNNVYEKTWSDEEAMDEALDNFDLKNEEELAIICDDCYIKFMQWYEKEEN